MTAPVLVGPLLGFENDGGKDVYTVCVYVAKGLGADLNLVVDDKSIPLESVGSGVRGELWRAEITPAAFGCATFQGGQTLQYRVKHGSAYLTDHNGEESAWEFYIPRHAGEARILYASCNGFSGPRWMNRVKGRFFALWERALKRHKKNPYALLVMGGDQLYADEIMSRNKFMEGWWAMSIKERAAKTPPPGLDGELDAFYEELYIHRWNQKPFNAFLAGVPSLMMWDDHEIYDGWGSYDELLQRAPIFALLFQYAAKYFELFQIRSRKNRNLLNPAKIKKAWSGKQFYEFGKPGGAHFSFACRFQDTLILGMDNRAQRTRETIMPSGQWKDIDGCLAAWQRQLHSDDGKLNGVMINRLLVLSAVPTVYLKLGLVERLLSPRWLTIEQEDDIMDHWNAGVHESERHRLFKTLFEFMKSAWPKPETRARVFILSGDVHVGGLGRIRDTDRNLEMHQIISSGIVHPPPNSWEWQGMTLISTEERGEYEGVEPRMISPLGADSAYIVSRNFVEIENFKNKKGNHAKTHVRWVCEDEGLSPDLVV